jgi:hypothetical protein
VRLVTRGIGASGQAPRGTADRKVDQTRCASGHDRPDASGREWTLTGLKPDAGCSASGRLSRASSHLFDCWNAESTIEIGRLVLNMEGHVDGIGRSDAMQHVRSVRPACSVNLKNRPVKG